MFRIFAAAWLLFAISWIAAAFWSTRPVRRAGLAAEVPFRICLYLGTIVLAIPAHGYRGPLRLWAVNLPVAWLCVAALLAGLAFCWAARIYLGRQWSGTVTIKPDHHLVDGGPYGVVRHPIYTGLLLAILATTIVKGTVLGVVGAVLVTIGLWMKARLEERWLSSELGECIYADYRRRVPMLIPFWPAG